jgi:glycolate oxidase iron-sulfur subunit
MLDKKWETCVKCGLCRSVCPVFREEKKEQYVARGHITLIEEFLKGNIDFSTKKAHEYLGKCLLCTTCVEACPNKAETDLAMILARIKHTQEYNVPFYKRILSLVMKNRKVMDFAAKTGRLMHNILFVQHLNTSRKGMSPRIGLGLIERKRLLLPIADKTFLEQYPSHIEGKNGRIAVFPGCGVNYAYREIGDAFIRICKKLNIEILIPKEQACCGGPLYFSGLIDTPVELAKKNIDLFNALNIDFVIVIEPTCASTTKFEYERLFSYLQDKEYLEKAKELSKLIISSEKYLHDYTPLKEMLKKTKIKEKTITYHDPCHLGRAQKVKQEPRALLNAIDGVNFVEMKDADTCCGNAGSFSVDFRETSVKIALRKAESIIETNADTVVTGCCGCIMQIAEALHIKGRDDIKVKHTLEIIDEALK